MPIINVLRPFTWSPPPPEPGKRTPAELRARSFKAHRVEDVPVEIARFAVTNKFATSPTKLPPEAPAAPPKPKGPTKAELAAAEAKAKADAKAKAGGTGSPPANPPGGSPPAAKLRFALQDPKAKTTHVVARMEGETEVMAVLTEQPLAKPEAEKLVADLEELAPETVEDAKSLAAGDL